MTDAEKLKMVKAMTGETDESILPPTSRLLATRYAAKHIHMTRMRGLSPTGTVLYRWRLLCIC